MAERGNDRRRPGRPQRPPLKLQTTTLWYYPSQQHSDEPMGTPGYEGRTPTWVIWNLLERYTREGDLVVDPFCGGGTTLDVARSMDRRAIGYDLRPVRDDIFRADARELPLEDSKADFVFMDPPYSTHIEYSEDPRCIGKLSAFEVGLLE
ncbi:MAG: class I SAM-dependent methyltransferase, partial [Planctomycetota bacterium]